MVLSLQVCRLLTQVSYANLYRVVSSPAFYNVVKRLYNTFVPASSQKVSLSTRREPALPAPQANFSPDEATTGTSVRKRRASSLMFRDALKSRSLKIGRAHV